LGPSNLWINTEVTNLVVGWGLTTVAFHRLDDGVKIVECDIPTLALCSHPDAEVTSRPLTIRILQ
jgi:hypothetical protein